ncbi:MAG TPA: lytic murein transglycosylase [Thermoleophilaceae bacterium]
MRKRLLYMLLAAAMVASLATLVALPASADTTTDGVSVPSVTVPGTTITTPSVTLPTVPSPTTPGSPTSPTVPTVPGTGGGSGGGSGSGSGSGNSTGTGTVPTLTAPGTTPTPSTPTTTGPGTPTPDKNSAKEPSLKVHLSPQKKHKVNPNEKVKTPLYQPDGAPAPTNPTFVDALPPSLEVTAVPNFVISQFHVPPFLLPIYQAAGIQYGIRWEVLAAINEIETDYGRNLNVSSAGAVGWMQFLPSTWKTWGVDGNRDGRKDPFNPVDAIFAAARYLKAAGGDQDIQRAIFAYNHAGWYVQSVMLRARLIAGVPPDVIGSLSGLTEGRFPVYAHARYADDIQIAKSTKKVNAGRNASQLIESSAKRKGINIFARKGAPVIAVNDGVIKKMGTSKKLGKYVVLQDVYGNQYTYSQLGSLARLYPVPKNSMKPSKTAVAALPANPSSTSAPAPAATPPATPAATPSVPSTGTKLPKPTEPATAGLPKPTSSSSNKAQTRTVKKVAKVDKVAKVPAPAQSLTKERLFAHPNRPNAQSSGGLDQIFNSQATSAGFSTFQNYFSRALGLNAKNSKLRRLHVGSHVIGGTILGRIGQTDPSQAAHVFFQIRPTGKGAPLIDPKPILDGWKLLEATAIYRASGKNALYSKNGDDLSIGQVLLLPKTQLEHRVLSDSRVSIYPCGRQDIETGQIDRRVLATLEYLADSGLNPTVSALKCGHSFLTTSGNVSEHSSGNAVDIAAINGIPIAGHQEAGGITEITVRRLMQLQGTMMPHQIISLLSLGANTMSLPDHWDHIHVGFHPLFGDNAKAGREALTVLKPGQWNDLVDRLRQIDNPVVPTDPSKYSIPVKPKADQNAPAGDD